MNAKVGAAASIAVIAIMLIAGHGIASTAAGVTAAHATHQAQIDCAGDPQCQGPDELNGGLTQ